MCEFVIASDSDPRFRERNLGLLREAAKQLGAEQPAIEEPATDEDET